MKLLGWTFSNLVAEQDYPILSSFVAMSSPVGAMASPIGYRTPSWLGTMMVTMLMLTLMVITQYQGTKHAHDTIDIITQITTLQLGPDFTAMRGVNLSTSPLYSSEGSYFNNMCMHTTDAAHLMHAYVQNVP